MANCVSEGSYNILFIMAIIAALFFLLSSAYYYDRFNKASTGRLSGSDAITSKNMTMFSMIIATLSIALFFILYFGFSKRLVGVYTTPPR